jgi:hypothetical protein
MKLVFRVEHVHLHDECLIKELERMATAMENLKREVAEAKAGVASAKAAFAALVERLNQMVDDSTSLKELRAEVDGLAVELSDSTDELAAAIVAPGAGEEPAPEEPAPSGGVDQPAEGGPFVPSGDGSVNGPVEGDESAGPVENGNVNPGPVVE